MDESHAWWAARSAERGALLRLYLERGVSWEGIKKRVSILTKLRQQDRSLYSTYFMSKPFCVPVKSP